MNYFVSSLLEKSPNEREAFAKSLTENDVDDAGINVLVACIQVDDLELAVKLLNAGYNVNHNSPLGSPLGAAISSTRPKAFQIFKNLMIRRGRFSEPEDPMHYCPELNEPMLHASIRRRSIEVIKLLLEYGYDPAWADTDGVTALELSESIDAEIYSFLRERTQK